MHCVLCSLIDRLTKEEHILTKEHIKNVRMFYLNIIIINYPKEHSLYKEAIKWVNSDYDPNYDFTFLENIQIPQKYVENPVDMDMLDKLENLDYDYCNEEDIYNEEEEYYYNEEEEYYYNEEEEYYYNNNDEFLEEEEEKKEHLKHRDFYYEAEKNKTQEKKINIIDTIDKVTDFKLDKFIIVDILKMVNLY